MTPSNLSADQTDIPLMYYEDMCALESLELSQNMISLLPRIQKKQTNLVKVVIS